MSDEKKRPIPYEKGTGRYTNKIRNVKKADRRGLPHLCCQLVQRPP